MIENDRKRLKKPILYKQYVGDTYAKTKRDETDKLFDTSNSYHPNIKLTVEENQTMKVFKVFLKVFSSLAI